MELRISATEVTRRWGDVLGGLRFRGDTYVIERNGEPIARLSPIPGSASSSLGEGLRAWIESADARDLGFASDLEAVNATDQPPTDPWA